MHRPAKLRGSAMTRKPVAASAVAMASAARADMPRKALSPGS